MSLLAPLLLAWHLTSVAHADPIALRAPQGALGVVVAVPDSSVAGWLTSHVGLSVDVHPWSTVGASVGYRGDVFRKATGFGLELSVAGGPTLPVLDPGAALSATPSASLGWAGRGVDATLGLAVPAVLRIAPDPDLRLPVIGEVWLGGRVGGVRLGGTFGAGQMWITGAPVELGWHLGLYVAVGAPPL